MQLLSVVVCLIMIGMAQSKIVENFASFVKNSVVMVVLESVQQNKNLYLFFSSISTVHFLVISLSLLISNDTCFILIFDIYRYLFIYLYNQLTLTEMIVSYKYVIRTCMYLTRMYLSVSQRFCNICLH